MNDATAAQSQPEFNIEKLYVKDLSLEIPHAPTIFLEREQSQVDLQLHSQASMIENSVYEVTITATITSKLPEKDLVAFLIEAKYAGIFIARNLPQEDLNMVLGVTCPNILYPYLREVVSEMAVRGGFAPVILTPVNFEEQYHNQRLQQAEGATATA